MLNAIITALALATGIFVSNGLTLPYVGHLTRTDMNLVALFLAISGGTALVMEIKNKKG